MRAWAAFALAGGLFVAVLGVLAGVLPERVPLHFGPSLEPDRVGDRTTFLALATGAGLLVTLLIGGSAALIQRVPPNLVNVPHRAYWTAPEHLPELRRRLRTDLLLIGALTLLLLAAMFALTGQAAVTGGRLSPWAYVVVGGYLAVVLTYSWYAVGRRYRPPAG